MTGDVPPPRQCTIPSCEREAVDPTNQGALCERHLDGLGDRSGGPESATRQTGGLDEYEWSGYAIRLEGESDRRVRAHDAAVKFTASANGPAFTTSSEDADGEWWKPAYFAACSAVERAIIKALLADKDEGHESEPGGPTADPDGAWHDVFPADSERRTYPRPQYEREYWMGAAGVDGKQPFAIWGDPDAPAACNEDGHTTADECDCDARWKWGYAGHYRAGADAELALDDPRLDTLTYILQDDEPTLLVDGDKVVDPETGDVHPAFIAILDELGATYADISLSETGTHAIYQGALPDDVKQAAWQLDDEPWGVNDELPSIEFYDHGRVCVMTGKHVTGTPTEARPVDADALETLLDERDLLPDEDAERPRDRFDDFDADDYTPSATSAGETTDDVRDVFAALDRLDAREVADRAIVRAWNDDASTSDGKRAFWPTWGSRNDNGTANVVDERIWQDTGSRGGYGGPVVMALIDAGELSDRNASPGDARGALFWKGVERLRELGFDVPEFDGSSDPVPSGDPVAVLPTTIQARATASEWDWRGDRDDELTIEAARERCQATIERGLECGDRRLVEALPTLGKSSGVIRAAAATDTPITVLTGRGRKEQYEQFRQWCEEQGLTHYTLPSFLRDCATASGAHGDEWAETVRDWYDRGATPQDIHKLAEYELGRPLPCQAADHDCPYSLKWDVDADDYDVLIGHYAHAHNQHTVTKGRAVVFDEFPGAVYETTLETALPGAVTYFLQSHDGLPFDDYTDLIEHRGDEARRGEALLWFEEHDLDRDSHQAIADSAGHAAAPLATFTLLAGAADDLGNGWERADLQAGTGLHDRESGRVHLLTPPSLQYTTGLVALDGTPTPAMWELALDEDLNHRPVLSDDERREYIRDALQLSLVETTEFIKPYNNPDHVHVDEDAALLEAIAGEHDTQPSLITTAAAEHEYDREGVLELVDDRQHYGNVLGSNTFASTRVGAVIGSQHYGDQYIEKWGAYAGEAVERGDGKGADLSYGEFGDRVLTHMREHETLQAAMRFGRDGNGAAVYVHTATLPEWVPRAGEGRVVRTRSDGERQVINAARDLGMWTTAELAAHPDVSVGERQVRDHLARLVDDGVISRAVEGCGFVWRDDGLHRLGEHGEVELAPVDPADLSDEKSAELARSTIYTWEFRTSDANQAGSGGDAATGDAPAGAMAATGGDPPPDDPS